MKVLHAGNMVNLGYVITKQLRNENLNAELIMEKNPTQMSDPLVFDSKLTTYPDWIYFLDKTKFSWKLNLIKKMRQNYDIIHADVEFPIFAYLSGKKFIAQTQGSDLRELAFSNSVKGILLRKAYHKAKAIIFFQPDHYPLFSKLNLKNEIFLPPGGYTAYYEPTIFTDDKYANKFLIFHPSDLNWRLKGNDILLKGFAEFLKDNSDSFMVIVDRGIDSDRTHALVKQLHLENNIEFIKGPLKPHELKKFYNIADVVADHFVYGSLGSIGWEVLSSQKPLLGFIFDDLYAKLYGESPPILNAKNSKQIQEQLEIIKDTKLRHKVGQLSRNWITKYHSPKTFSKKLIRLYELVIEGKKIDEIKYEIEKIPY